jgi:hypothetical protein
MITRWQDRVLHALLARSQESRMTQVADCSLNTSCMFHPSHPPSTFPQFMVHSSSPLPSLIFPSALRFSSSTSSSCCAASYPSCLPPPTHLISALYGEFSAVAWMWSSEDNGLVRSLADSLFEQAEGIAQVEEAR